MITAVFYKKGRDYSGFRVSGHAEYADPGEDIVCASVTSAVQLSANLITESFHINAEADAVGDTVTLKVAETCEEASRIIDGLKTHLELLSEEFENTIITKISEV
ncbi:MAG: ribosomal-processing cysteine protease Prp [Oscillospiraceae bacterium]|nr:ribosomal-processing cysteine protease Prp [Oscillospiraceae bacterium]